MICESEVRMAVAVQNAGDRYALYYPWIHIRNENWLKGTLLAFGRVRRIVPVRFTLKDGAITAPYARLTDAAGAPLLQPADLASQQVVETQKWLRGKISAHLDELGALYSEETTPLEYQSGPDSFEMHAGKFVDPDLLGLLCERNLAWYSRESGEPDSDQWITMHPIFGAAIMSILALAIARLEGLSVVTPSGRAHRELLANREEEVFETLLGVSRPPGALAAEDVTAEELAHVVITTGFDLTRLTPEQISELLKQGKDLRRFHTAIAEFASRIPAGLGHSERAARIRREAQSVLDEWNDYASKLPAFAKEALSDATLDKAPDVLTDAVAAGVREGAKAAILSTVISLPTVAVSLAVSAGFKMFRRRDTPLRFLSRVNHAANRSIGSIYVPRWTALAAQSAV